MSVTYDTPVVRWDGCYDAGWRELIVPGAFAHPAKMARGLVARIFDELFEMGALERGSICVDPFGGIGTTAIEGASRGVQVFCCELEPKFVGLQRENFELHRRDWQAMGRPMPVVVQGDSRKLREVLGAVIAECVVTSPPYASSDQDYARGRTSVDWEKGARRGMKNDRISGPDAAYGDSLGQLGAMTEGNVEAIISSPPYVSGGHHPDQTGAWNTNGRGQNANGTGLGSKDAAGYGKQNGQLGQMSEGSIDAVVSSPPYTEEVVHARPSKMTKEVFAGRTASSGLGAYGETSGQLGAMDAGNVDAIVCSPPYSTGDSASAQSITTRSDKSAEWVKKNCGSAATEGYGLTAGQLGVMPSGDVDAVVSSPPYEGSLADGGDVGIKWEKARRETTGGGEHQAPGGSVHARYPNESDGQIGNATGETFWSAARDIVAESYAILKPGGVAVWVVKHFVRKGQLVDFPGDWRKLCEHVGFETLQEVHASLVAEETKPDLFDGERTVRRERKSFFRRLAEKKGSPRIDFETVYFMRKPARAALGAEE